MAVPFRELDVCDERERVLHRLRRELGDADPADGDGQRLRLQTRTLARRTRDLPHVLFDALALVVRLRLLVSALQPRDRTFVVRVVRALASVPGAVADVDLLVAGAVEKDVAVRLRQTLPRLRLVDAEVLARGFQHPVEVLEPRTGPRTDRAFGD